MSIPQKHRRELWGWLLLNFSFEDCRALLGERGVKVSLVELCHFQISAAEKRLALYRRADAQFDKWLMNLQKQPAREGAR